MAYLKCGCEIDDLGGVTRYCGFHEQNAPRIDYAVANAPDASEVATQIEVPRVADTVTVGAWNKPPVIGYGSVYFYAVPTKQPHEWAIRRHGELPPVAFADSTDEAEDLVGLLESTADYFMELCKSSIRELDRIPDGMVAALLPRELAESIVSHTFTTITPREGAAIYEDACRVALSATREQTAQSDTSDAALKGNKPNSPANPNPSQKEDQ